METHIVTSAVALPLMLETGPGLLVEITDGTRVNAEVRAGVGFYYDFVKASVERLVKNFAAEVADRSVTAVGVTPEWLCSERMLQNFGVTEANWRDACATCRALPSRSPRPMLRAASRLWPKTLRSAGSQVRC